MRSRITGNTRPSSECVSQLDCDPIPTISAAAVVAAAVLVLVPFAIGAGLGWWIASTPEVQNHADR
jgi:hypothetical protein